MKRIVIIILLGIDILSANAQHSASPIDFLEGLWKVDGSESYEVWERVGDDHLEEKAYKVKGGKQHIAEKLEIKKDNNGYVYYATVFAQNDGETIAFRQNNEVEDTLSFENPDHDFPKKIIYQRVTDDQLFVQVLGEGNKGFSFEMTKVIEAGN